MIVNLVLAAGLAATVPPPPPVTDPVWLSDLDPKVRASVATGDLGSAKALLDRILSAAPAYVFEGGPVVATTDRRWFGNLPADDPAAPLLEVRRWPGDSLLAIWAVSPSPEGSSPPVPGGVWGSPESAGEGGTITRGSIDGETRPAIWVERPIEGAPARLGILLLPSDAGLGSAALASIAAELMTASSRIRIRPDVWARVPVLAAGARVRVPEMEDAPGDRDERTDSWRSVAAHGMTIGFPPGVRARRLDTGTPPPRPIAGGLLWFRGRFTDREGTAVVVGDGDRAGYVAEVRPPGAAWVAGAAAPLGAPGAAAIAGDSFSLARDRAEAASARAERWKEPGFGGEWLVFRIAWKERGIEIGMPVVEGRRSPALFWIPATWRDESRPPAPPPIDPSERFGIRFDPNTPVERHRRPWVEGVLDVPGLRLEVPTGWWPVASLRSRDGFPIVLMEHSGKQQGKISLVEAPPESGPGPGWTRVERPSAYGAQAVYEAGDGTRIYVGTGGRAFRFEPEAQTDATTWRRMLESASLQAASARPPAAKGASPAIPAGE